MFSTRFEDQIARKATLSKTKRSRNKQAVMQLKGSLQLIEIKNLASYFYCHYCVAHKMIMAC